MALFFLMLTRGTAARTSANFYLVPGVTALMAWLSLGEGLAPLAVVGLVTASFGCFLVAAPQRGHGSRRRNADPVRVQSVRATTASR
jgi:drug/metabolite transporter (DMT)-like permease